MADEELEQLLLSLQEELAEIKDRLNRLEVGMSPTRSRTYFPVSEEWR